jgi:hypothetical protein
MKIIGIKAENFKKLKVVDLSPPGDLVEITGGNEQGKTSLMDGVQLTLCGLKSRDDIPEPIRRGEDKATFEVTLGESPEKVLLVARRVWRKSGTFDFVLENAEGAEYKGPQAMMDKIVGAIALDPGKFGQMDGKKQLETLLKLVDIGIDLREHAEKRNAVFDARTIVNRDIVDLEGQMKLILDVPEGTPDEEISAASVLAEQETAHRIKSVNDEARAELKQNKDMAETYLHDIAETEARINALKQELKDAQDKLIRQHTEREALLDIVKRMENVTLRDPDMTVFAKKISEVEETNRQVRIKKKRVELKAAFKMKSDRAAVLTAEIAALDKKKSDALTAAKMPIEGLSFDENGVRYNGTPFCQCSSEERLRVSCAMAAAMNPKLKVIFARDASLLDGKHREILKAFAKDRGYQLWMELADDSGKFGIIFEDGSIVPAKKGE